MAKTRGAEALWQEVLTRALQDAKEGPTEQELRDYVLCTRRDAEEWLKTDSRQPGGFLWVCDLLGLDPSAVRRKCFGRTSRGL